MAAACGGGSMASLLLKPGIPSPMHQSRRKLTPSPTHSAPKSDFDQTSKPASSSCAPLPPISSCRISGEEHRQPELGGSVGRSGPKRGVSGPRSRRGASAAPQLAVAHPALRGATRSHGEMGGQFPVFCSGKGPLPSTSGGVDSLEPQSRRGGGGGGGGGGEAVHQVADRAIFDGFPRFPADDNCDNSAFRDVDEAQFNGGDPWLTSENGVRVRNGRMEPERTRQRVEGDIPQSQIFESHSQESSRDGITPDDGHSLTSDSDERTPELPTGVLARDSRIESAEVSFPTVKEVESEILNTKLPYSGNGHLISSPQGQDAPALSKSKEGATGRKGLLADGLANARELLWQWGKTGGDRTGVEKIISRDLEVLKEGITLAKRSLGNLLRMEGWDGSKAVVDANLSWPEPQYYGLSGKELLAADIGALSSYRAYAMGLLRAYRIPLQRSYDPEAIASYFNRRPHLLLFRLAEVFTAFTSVSVRHLLDKSELRRAKSRLAGKNTDQFSIRSAEGLKRTLVTLGPTFIKVAQSLSSRPDIIGSDTAKVLSELQDRLPPFPTKDAVAVIEEELGVPSTQCFSFLSRDPVAAASFGQVYRGMTVEGEEVAVKVQRPDMLYSVARDVYVLRLGLGILRKVAKMNSDISVLADEVGVGLFGELDYALEAANAREFGSAHEHLSYMKVPKTLSHLTRRRVLTMEWIHGDRPVDLLRIANGHGLHGAVCSMEQRLEAKRSLDALVRKGVESSLVQLLETGVMHADPHPGNLLCTKEGILAYLDFGLLTRVDAKHRAAMLAVIAHLVNGEWQNLADDFAELDILKPTTDRFALRLALERAFGDGPNAVVRNGVPDIQFGQVTGKLWKVALKFRFRLPAYYTFVLRSLASLEGMAVSVDPNYKVFAAAYPYVIRRLLSDNSPATRRVLQSLVLTQRGEFRWDRISALVATSIKGTSRHAQPPSKEWAGRLLSFAVSREGGPVRRVILEADTNSLANAFVSHPARKLRRKASHAIGDSFCDEVLRLRRLEPKQTAMGSGADCRSGTTVPITGRISVTNGKLAGGTDVLPVETVLDVSSVRIFKNRRLWFLLRALAGRLRRNPIVALRVSWAFATMMGLAAALTLRRYIMTVIDRLSHLLPTMASKRIQRPAESGRRRRVQGGSVYAASAP